jgi:16S rRNA (uracil1498-N3)-methyltransferase
VLSPNIGDTLKIGILNGAYGQAVVRNISSKAIRLECIWSDEQEVQPPTTSLILAMPRPKVFKRLLPQIASLGVDKLIITNASKVEKNYFATHWLKPDNYNKLIINGLEQSGDTKVPNLRVVKRLKPFIEDELSILFPNHSRLIAHPYTDNKLSDVTISGNKLLAIGPEGGWDAFELEMFKKAGFQSFTLGSRILRSDTTTIAVLASLAQL